MSETMAAQLEKELASAFAEENKGNDADETVSDDLPEISAEDTDNESPDTGEVDNDDDLPLTDEDFEQETVNSDSADGDETTSDDEDLYNSLDDTPEDNDTVKVNANDPKGVQKRISRAVKERDAALERARVLEENNLKYQKLLNDYNAGQVPQPAMSQSAMQQPQIADLPLNKDWQEMSAEEQFDYLAANREYKTNVIQQHKAQQMVVREKEAEFQKVIATLNQYKDKDDTINFLMTTASTTPGIDHSFTRDMLAALSRYKNSPQIVRYLHKAKRNELTRLLNTSPQMQREETIRMAERYNLELEQRYKQKATQKKPVPPGKVKGVNTVINKDSVYTSKYLDALSPSQLNKLKDKGF